MGAVRNLEVEEAQFEYLIFIITKNGSTEGIKSRLRPCIKQLDLISWDKQITKNTKQ